MIVSPGFFASMSLASSSELADRFAVDRDDDVAADGHLAVFGGSGEVAAADARLFGGRALLHALHERAALDRQVERRQRPVDRQRGQAEVGAAHGAAFLELGDLRLGGVDRHREADAHAAVAAASGLDLGVDPDHLPGGVEQRTARVAGVDRRIGLQHVVDREAVGRRYLALQRGDDAGREGAFEVERVADREHRIADLDRARVTERERVQRQAVGGDAQNREIVGGILADHLGVDRLPFFEAHGDLDRVLDDVVVGEDRAVRCRSRFPSRSPRPVAGFRRRRTG